MSAEQIKVLHVIQGLSLGGGARTMVAAAKYSARLGGFQHRVASLLPAAPESLNLSEEAGMTVIDAPDRNALLHEIEETDIVLVHWWNNL